MSEGYLSDVYPVRERAAWEVGRTVITANDVSEFAVGVVERGEAGWAEGVDPGAEDKWWTEDGHIEHSAVLGSRWRRGVGMSEVGFIT